MRNTQTGAGNYPAGVTDAHPYFTDESETVEVDARELECGCIEFSDGTITPCDEDRCEVREGEDRCSKPRTLVVREPYTPAAFEIHACLECAQSLVDFGYIAPMSLRRIEARLKAAYKNSTLGSFEETYYFDGLLEVLLRKAGYPTEKQIPREKRAA